jgi:precorrin-3B synthase
VRDKSVGPLTAALMELELADPSPEAEAVRNVLVSPLAGLDPACKDGTAIAQALETELRLDTSLHALPAKFDFAIDGGGLWPLGQTGADITAVAADTDDHWRIVLAGSGTTSQALPWHAVADAMLALARVFIARRTLDGCVRMRQLVAAAGAEAIAAAAGLEAGPSVARRQRAPVVGYANPSLICHLATVGLPFGEIAAGALMQLCEAVPAAGLRLTPWRAVAVVCTTQTEARRVLTVAGPLGLAITSTDARLAIDACTGAPGCGNGTTATREDAAQIAAHLGSRAIAPGSIHISGCTKGCAHRGTAPITFVGRDGRYDLVLNGAPNDTPIRTGIASADIAATIASVLP